MIEHNVLHVQGITLLKEGTESGDRWKVVLIEPGLSLNNNYYSSAVLKDSVSIFNGVKSYAYEFRGADGTVFDHLPESVKKIQPKDFIKNIVGWFENCAYETYNVGGKIKEGVTAEFIVTADWLKKLLLESVKSGKELVGFSIDASGSAHREQDKMIVDKIIKGNSIDVVSYPAAGGKTLRLVASVGFIDTELMTTQEASATNCVKEEIMVDKKKEVKLKEEEKMFACPDGCETSDKEGVCSKCGKKMTMTKMEEGTKGDIIVEIEKVVPQASPVVVKEAKVEEVTKIVEAKVEAPVVVIPKSEEKPMNDEIKKELDGLKESYKTELAEVSKEKADIRKMKDDMIVEKELSGSDLPDVSKTRLQESYNTGKILASEMKESIVKEKEYLAKINPNTVTNLGDKNAVEVGEEQTTKIGYAMDGLFEGKDVGGVRRFRTLKEAYAKINGSSLFDVDPLTVLAESTRYRSNANLKESMTVASWAQVLGDSITRKMISSYNLPSLNDWRKIVSDISSPKDFRTQRRMRMGGYGTLSTVAEQGTYQSLTSPTDQEATYAVSKKGGLEDLTIEMIANDDVGAVKRIPTALGRAAAQTLYRAVFDLLLNNSTMTLNDDATAIATSGHANLGATALSAATLSAARIAMMKQAAYGNSTEVLGMTNLPKYLIVPAALEETARRLSGSATYQAASVLATGGTAVAIETSPNVHQGIEVIVVPYWDGTDADNWWVTADPKNIPTIEVGFFGGNEEPELFVQDQETVGSVFTADKITYKIRHIWGVCSLEYRAFYGSIVG